MTKLLLTFLTVTLSILLTTNMAYAQTKEQSKQLQGGATTEAKQDKIVKYLVREVRHQLITLPYYNVFDWLEGEAKPDGTVILRGQVVRPTTKSEAESRVKDIEGVEKVVNEIEVLPLSPNDERIRRATYFALFNENSPLFRYATQAIPSIHIIVDNGHVTLKGLVANEMDSQFANIKAQGVNGVFEVKNQLQIEQSN